MPNLVSMFMVLAITNSQYQSIENTARRFCDIYTSYSTSDIFDIIDRENVQCLLTTRLLNILKSARACREDWIRMQPEGSTDKPPWVDCCLFSAASDGLPTSFELGLVRTIAPETFQVKIHYFLKDRGGEIDWYDALIIKREDNQYLIDDFEYNLARSDPQSPSLMSIGLSHCNDFPSVDAGNLSHSPVHLSIQQALSSSPLLDISIHNTKDHPILINDMDSLKFSFMPVLIKDGQEIRTYGGLGSGWPTSPQVISPGESLAIQLDLYEVIRKTTPGLPPGAYRLYLIYFSRMNWDLDFPTVRRMKVQHEELMQLRRKYKISSDARTLEANYSDTVEFTLHEYLPGNPKWKEYELEHHRAPQ